tara:strand:- start:234 stop:377 length:144 start_codon:yes stop_codon:yes gene_type:complete
MKVADYIIIALTSWILTQNVMVGNFFFATLIYWIWENYVTWRAIDGR